MNFKQHVDDFYDSILNGTVKLNVDYEKKLQKWFTDDTIEFHEFIDIGEMAVGFFFYLHRWGEMNVRRYNLSMKNCLRTKILLTQSKNSIVK